MKTLNPLSFLTAAVVFELGLPGLGISSAIAQAAPDAYTNCRSAANSVVTLYAGKEIGAGSIVNSSGLLVTNYHVVREAVQSKGQTKIFVKLANGNRYIGQAVASDPRSDLALVQFTPNETLTPIRFGSSESVRPGQTVCAIGSPKGKTGVLTQGTLIGIRSNNDLRSNLRLYGGNSGGPLLNDQGDMIGINKSIWLSETGENTGISFAINLATTQRFIEQAKPGALNTAIARQPVLNQPTVAQRSPSLTAPVSRPTPVNQPVLEPYILAGGVTPMPIPPEAMGQMPGSSQVTPDISASQPVAMVEPSLTPVPAASAPIEKKNDGRLGVILDAKNLVVRQVEIGSAADMGGLRPGDRLVAINGRSIQDLEQIRSFLQQRPSVGMFTVDRNSRSTVVQVKF